MAADQPVLSADNRGYRYGDGFFETMKIEKGKAALQQYHINRIENSSQLLQYQLPQTRLETIFEEVFELCHLNNCADLARVRLSFSNGRGSVFEANTAMDYIIEASPLEQKFNTINAEGLSLGICPLVKKSCDEYANLKSANYLVYRVAADYAKRNQWNDAFVLNQNNNIIESTIANLFWIKNDKIFTPSLAEGCVQGVMRAYLIDALKRNDTVVEETFCTEEILKTADELFLTNAVNGIRWVHLFNGKNYRNDTAKKIYNNIIAPLLVNNCRY